MSRLLLVSEVASILRLSQDRVRELIAQGKLRARRMGNGGRWLIAEDDIDAALASARPIRASAGGAGGGGN
jgi:excisionase family DNA binding protein